MEVKWTKEQEQVINLRDRNLLVSAAAGSGKTAVLVERIIKRITDIDNPVDIDKILVVTFTKAAAAEMRERISDALEALREDNPEDENLQRQSTLIHNALITTIDSFCLFAVRNHFGEINLDPNFRIADTGEIKLLESDVLNECFEANYGRKDNQAFLNLIDLYAGSRNDDKVREMVLKIYHMAQSDSWPKAWIKSLGDMYNTASEDELLVTPIFLGIASYITNLLTDYRHTLCKLREIALEEDGPQKYLPTLDNDISSLEKIDDIDDFKGLFSFFESFSMGNFAAIRDKDASEEKKLKKEKVQTGRNKIKKEIEDIRKEYFSSDITKIREQLNRLRPIVDELIRIAIEYTDAVDEKKRQKRIVDFNDIEHFALRIFVDENTKEATSTAREFREHFEEIMIDEYQDSNQVQEDILCSISKMSDGRNNMFMVGDVKQSIYRFRLARPELFMHKYNTYSTQDSDSQRIDLHKNFRSRSEVLDFANDIFYKVMQMDMGGVAYDKDSALYLGADYPAAQDKKAELLLIDTKEEDFAKVLEDEEKSVRIEALVVAQKINDMMAKMQITDKKSRQLRALKYSDIVILFRGIKANGADFVQVLSECGIPAHVESQSGYFDTYEVQTVLNMLRILDNPLQDIPMTAVLKSPIVGLDDEEMAEIRIKDTDKSFAGLVIDEMEAAEEGKLYEFNKLYCDIRKLVKDTPVHELIQVILDRTGFGRYAAAMPAGERRKLNLEMLVQRAVAYENTSYKGLFHFIRYIDQLHKYEVDFGEAETVGENEDVVRIMTIHKSKGLEFPVVFVCGTGRKFNQRDTSDNLVLHTSLGIGLNEISGSPKVKRKSLVRSEIANTIKLENLGEELRVLYVALTRAKEKLILTGCISDAAKTLQGYEGNVIQGMPVSFKQRAQATRYLDWIIPAMLSYPDKYDIDFVSADELAERQAEDMASLDIDRTLIEKRIETSSDELISSLTERFSFEYKYKTQMDKKSKYSVSELKHDSMVEIYDSISKEAEIPEFLLEEKESYIPCFMSNADAMMAKDDTNPGAKRGTAIHRVMECLDFKAILDIDCSNEAQMELFVDNQIIQMQSKRLISEDMVGLVPNHMIKDFIKTPIAMRMAKADKKGMLFKEKPFVMDYEGVLLQGIIDVFWMEDDKIMLLDYKTDRVNNSQELVARYKKQLDLYADALSRLFGTGESLIYSFCLKEVIEV